MSLKSRSAFSQVYRNGSRKRVGSVTVLSLRGDPGIPRVGVVAGRRVGGAVVRNRAKRRIREAMRSVALQDGTAYVVVAGPGVERVPFDRLVEWLRRASDPEKG